MRIGILTLPLHINYGGIIQAYALQTVLERMGHEVVVYQRDQLEDYRLPFWKYPLSFTKRLFVKLFINKKQEIFVEKKRKIEFPIIRQHTNRFINEHIHVSLIRRLNDIDLSKIDCIIVGSDQIWRPYHVHNLFKSDITDVFLNFAEGWNGKRVAYAVSFGVEEWEYSPKQSKECRRLVKLFDAVSVREKSAIKLCSDYLGIEAAHVLDPTLLLYAKDYLKLIKIPKEKESKDILFYYILDETIEKKHLVERVAKDRGLNPFSTYTDTKKTINQSVEERIIPSLEDWLLGFYTASFVVTDSFHGCVFSIIFGKPFIAIGNIERGYARFLSLLSHFHLENNLLLKPEDYKKECNYRIADNVFEILERSIKGSKAFLIKSLGEG